MTPQYIIDAMETTFSDLKISSSPNLTLASGSTFSNKFLRALILGMACNEGSPESSLFLCTKTDVQDMHSKLPKGFGVANCFGEDYFMDLLEVYLGEESCIEKMFIEEIPKGVSTEDIRLLAKKFNKQVFAVRP